MCRWLKHRPTANLKLQRQKRHHYTTAPLTFLRIRWWVTKCKPQAKTAKTMQFHSGSHIIERPAPSNTLRKHPPLYILLSLLLRLPPVSEGRKLNWRTTVDLHKARMTRSAKFDPGSHAESRYWTVAYLPPRLRYLHQRPHKYICRRFASTRREGEGRWVLLMKIVGFSFNLNACTYLTWLSCRVISVVVASAWPLSGSELIACNEGKWG